MEFKTILVHLDHPDRAADVVMVAKQIAERFDSTIIGLYVVPSLKVLGALASGGAGPDFVRQHRAMLFEQSEQCEQEFCSILAGTPNASQWKRVDSQLDRVSDEVLRHVRTSDLTVISQAPEDDDTIFVAETLENVVQNGGRPVLMVPLGFSPNDRFGRNVLVAWDGSKEASRALSDSLPLLQQAQKVNSVWVINQSSDPISVADVKLRFCEWLARHSVTGVLKTIEADDHEVAGIIERYIQELECDVLVAGGYGDSRLKEYLTGGVSRAFLKHCRVPLFMTN